MAPPRWLAPAAAALTALVSHVGVAEASCGTPAWVGTESHTAIPTEGVLYAVSAWDITGKLQLGGGTTWTIEPATGPSGFDMVALRYRGATGTVSVALDDWNKTDLEASATWTAPATPPRVVSIGRTKHEWMCSYQDAIALQVDQPVAAFRVRYFSDDRGWVDMIVPPRASTDRTASPTLMLGKIDCAGETVPLDLLAAGVVVDVRAIRFDGSEVAVEGVPQVLDLDDVAPFTPVRYLTSVELLSLVEASHLPGAVIPAPRGPSGPRTGATALALVGLAALLGVFRGRALAAAMGVAKLPVAVLRK